jgi:hypothetical protein
LEVEKHHFISIIGPQVNKYMFQHVSGPIFTKNGPEILGVKLHVFQQIACGFKKLRGICI